MKKPGFRNLFAFVVFTLTPVFLSSQGRASLEDHIREKSDHTFEVFYTTVEKEPETDLISPEPETLLTKSKNRERLWYVEEGFRTYKDAEAFAKKKVNEIVNIDDLLSANKRILPDIVQPVIDALNQKKQLSIPHEGKLPTKYEYDFFDPKTSAEAPEILKFQYRLKDRVSLKNKIFDRISSCSKSKDKKFIYNHEINDIIGTRFIVRDDVAAKELVTLLRVALSKGNHTIESIRSRDGVVHFMSGDTKNDGVFGFFGSPNAFEIQIWPLTTYVYNEWQHDRVHKSDEKQKAEDKQSNKFLLIKDFRSQLAHLSRFLGTRKILDDIRGKSSEQVAEKFATEGLHLLQAAHPNFKKVLELEFLRKYNWADENGTLTEYGGKWEGDFFDLKIILPPSNPEIGEDFMPKPPKASSAPLEAIDVLKVNEKNSLQTGEYHKKFDLSAVLKEFEDAESIDLIQIAKENKLF